jgi:hypothetical protein
MNVFSPYSPFFISFLFLFIGATTIATLCVSKALGAERLPAFVRLNFLGVDFNRILRDDTGFSRHLPC